VLTETGPQEWSQLEFGFGVVAVVESRPEPEVEVEPRPELEPAIEPDLEPGPDLEPAPAPAPRIEIRPSTRRRKTVEAHWEGDTVVVGVPHRMSKRLQREYADELAAKLIAARAVSRPTDEALTERALALSQRYLDGAAVPSAVTWSTRQRSRWGSCSVAAGTIRISAMLQDAPDWVVDAVLVHELAHLLRAEHDATFRELVARYPRTEEADLFLAGYELGLRSRSHT
jgi:predicted metal-dependent hydrolase